MQERLETSINDKVRQLQSLNTKISSLSDPFLIESTIAKSDAEYKQLQLQQDMEEKEQLSQEKAVTDEIQTALMHLKEYEVAMRERFGEMCTYVRQRKEDCEKIKLLDS